MPTEFYFTPELHLKDGRVIRDIEDALAFAREQEPRPGVDQRDEVLHKMERAQSKEQVHAAAHAFVRWLEELEVLEYRCQGASRTSCTNQRMSPSQKSSAEISLHPAARYSARQSGRLAGGMPCPEASWARS
jgi:hypothetical protein